MEKGLAGDLKRLWQGGRRKLEILMAWLLLPASTDATLVATTSFKTMIDEVTAAEEAEQQRLAAAAATPAQAALAAGLPVVAPAATTSTYTVDLAGFFAKGIKLDESKFPKLENRTSFIVWKKAKRKQQNRSVNNTILQASESAKLAEMKQKYGNTAAKFSIPTEIYKSLPVPVQNAFKDWRKAEQKRTRNPGSNPGSRTQAANTHQQTATPSDNSTIASQGDWVVLRRVVYQAATGLPPVPEVVEVPAQQQNTAPSQAPTVAGTILRQFLSTSQPAALPSSD
jgi:hypothetical protein